MSKRRPTFQSLDWLLNHPDIPSHEPDARLDVDAQIVETLNFMTSRIPDDHFQGQRHSPHQEAFTRLIMREFMQATLRSSDIQDVIGKKMFGNPRRGVMKSVGNYIRRVWTKSTTSIPSHIDLWVHEATWLLYNDDILYGALDIAHRKGAPQYESVEEYRQFPMVQETRHALMKMMFEEVEQFRTAARHLPYELIEHNSLTVSPHAFFAKNQSEADSVGNEAAVARMAFCLLTAHIGYFPKPQYGKWEYLYAHSSGLSIPELNDMGIKVVPRTPQELLVEFNADRKILVQVFGHALRSYGQLHDEHAELQLTYKDAARDLKKASTAKDKAQRKVTELERRVTKLEAAAKQQRQQQKPKSRPQTPNDRLDRENTVLTERIVRLRGELDILMDDHAALQTNLDEAERQLLLANGTSQELVKVDYDDSLDKLDGNRWYEDIKPKIDERLSQPGYQGVPLRRGYGTNVSNVIPNLQTEFPDYDVFRKLELSGGCRALFGIRETGVRVVLHVFKDHDAYMSYCLRKISAS